MQCIYIFFLAPTRSYIAKKQSTFKNNKSFAELLSIGAALPFLLALTSPDKIFNNPNIEPIIQYFGFTKPQQIILPITFAFGLAAILAGGMRLFLLKVNTKFSFATGQILINNSTIP